MTKGGLWGTWEELVLGGAVLRHGTADWDAVASEFRSLTAFPHLFTPQVCEAKYEDLQDRYFGCDTWFEELRNQRVVELKEELEKSEDSIGSLQSKLESLTAEKESDCNNLDCDTSRTQSISPADGADAVGYFCKVGSRDGLSAGSFTRNTDREWTPECEIAATVSLQDFGVKMRLHEDFRVQMASNLCTDFQSRNCRKKRNPRKRRPCNVFKEASVGESEVISSAAKMDREETSEGCMQDSMRSSEKICVVQREEPAVDLAGIVDSISKNKDVSILRYRIENQKKGEYKKLIRRHVDLQTISSGISSGSISSAKELFRDLLLLCNNVLVFHKRNSPENKCAHSLRNIVKELLRHTFHAPEKLLSVAPCKRLIGRKRSVGEGAENESQATEIGKREKGRVGSPVRNRGIGRPPKEGRRGSRGCQVESSPSRGRKKACK